MLILIDRILSKITKIYRTHVFRAKIKTDKSVKLVGNVILINRNIKLGNNVTIYPNVLFYGDGPIVIGDNVAIGSFTVIYASKNAGVSIGNDINIAAHCFIIDSDHGMNKDSKMNRQEITCGKINIEDDVWIADNCTILKNSIIKKGAVIGAKSLVNGTIDSYGIAVGIPAKVIKYRS